MELLTVVIPCFEEQAVVDVALKENAHVFSKYPIIVVNKSGGDKFRQIGRVVDQDTSYWFARRFALELVDTKYVLNLDMDTILPQGYVEKAIEILETRSDVATVALNYKVPHGQRHLAFGTSVWRTEQLKKMYDWRLTQEVPDEICECEYMWKKVEAFKMKVETLPMLAIHYRDPRDLLARQEP